MLFDSHMHTKYSADSDMLLADALAAAEKQGHGIVLTEHLDFDYPGDRYDFTFSPEDYWAEYEPLRGDKLRLGVEVGMTPGCKARNESFVARAPFDEVICSIHIVDGIDIYEQEAYEGRTQDEMYERYFQLNASLLRENSYADVLGHIDYICRYAPYEEPGLSYGRWQEGIDSVLRAALETDTVLELNTRRLGDTLAVKQLVAIYRRYRQLGGRYVTIGSDAHRAEAVGAFFKPALALADACDLQVVTFCERKMQLCKII